MMLIEQYQKKILPELKAELGLGNTLSVPRVTHVVINAGVGRLLQQQPKDLDRVVAALSAITGQKPIITRARQAISAFKIRAGQAVGVRVTLRGKRMYDFLDKLVNIALPRTRDFRGISRKGFDGQGNYSLGVREHIVFPEMAQEEADRYFGLQVTVATSAKDDNAAYLLLKKMGFPFPAESGATSGGKDR